MRICYVLLSPTFGMHQYTADLANRMVQAGHDVSLVTTRNYPADRYLSGVHVRTPVETHDAGFSPDALRLSGARDAQAEIGALLPDVVHITGPHAWNVSLLWMLRQSGIPFVHSLHDLDAHTGTPYGRLLNLWNQGIIRQADHLLVHGRCYRQRLLEMGVPANRVTHTPLLHLSLGPGCLDRMSDLTGNIEYEPWALFFGRLERYKGVDHLLTAAGMLAGLPSDGPNLVLAGPGRLEALWDRPLPPGVELRSRLIRDDETFDLFRQCGLVVLPYRDATQSALIAHAYFFQKPAIVTRTGALPEYVVEGETGWVVPPNDSRALAGALQAALAQPGVLAQMGQAGRAWYERQRQAETAALQEMYATCRAFYS